MPRPFPPLAAATTSCHGVSVHRDTRLISSLDRHELTTPFDVDRGDSDARHPPSFAITVRAFGVDHRLELERHELLLSDTYATWDADASGLTCKTGAAPHAHLGGHCHYRGRLAGDPSSVVAVSICDGVRGEIFSHSLEGGSLSLEPAHRHLPDVRSPGARTTRAERPDGPLHAPVVAFRRADAADEVRSRAEALARDVRRADERRAFRVVDDASPDRLDAPIRVEDGTRVGTRVGTREGTRDGASSPEIRGGRRRLTQASASDIFVELIVFNDEARVSSYGGDTVLLHDDSLHVLNVVAALYERSGFAPRVHPVLVAQVDFSQGDPWSSDVDAIADGQRDVDATLEGFKDWRGSNYESLPAHDAGHLFSGEDFFYFALDADGNRQLDGNGDVIVETGVVGLAYQWGNYNTSVCEEREVCGDVVRVGNADGTTSLVTIGDGDCYGTSNSDMMCCRPHSSVALSQVWRDKISFDALTVAHEIGHQLGFQHDGMGGEDGGADLGTGDCPVSGYVMQYLFEYGSNPSVFSECSVRTFDATAAANKYQCLTSGYTRVCGNGLLEPGEQCDCGTHDCALVDPCCDGDTCTLRDGATCSAAEGGAGCCDPTTCAPRAAGFVCRDGARFCDIAETCDGTSSACPADRHMPLGTSCEDATGDGGSCWDGQCVNRNASCSEISSVFFAPPALYGGKSASESCPLTFAGRALYEFDEDSCETTGLRCFDEWDECLTTSKLLRGQSTSFGALAGFPCSTAVETEETLANGTNATLRVHPRVCSGGPGRNGVGSRCVDRESLIPSPPPPPSPITPPAPPLDGGPVSAATGWGGVVLGAVVAATVVA